MKIAMSSYSGMGAWFVLRLIAEGHKVDYFLSKPEYEDVLRGLIPEPKVHHVDQRRHLLGYGFPSYKGYDLSLFDLTGTQKQAEACRLEGVPTFGDGYIEHMLEDDREFGLNTMKEAGINVPPFERFETASEGKAFIKKTGKRYVYKPYEGSGGSDDKSLTYVAKSAEDLIEFIDDLWKRSKNNPFILQEFVTGEEIGVAAYFNGTQFFLQTGTLEEKKFMNDNKGPNTGCSGNLVFAMNEEMKIYKEGLAKVEPILRQMRYRGIIDLNSIVTEDTFYGLEWTPRFGYVSDPTIATMYGDGFGDMLFDISSGKNPTIKWGGGSFGAAVTLSIPPYPTEIRVPKAKGVPIEGIDPKDLAELMEIYLYDAMVVKGKLETSGNFGYIGAVLSASNSIEGAFGIIKGKMEKINIPNCQYRTDIEKSTTRRYEQIRDWGWLR